MRFKNIMIFDVCLEFLIEFIKTIKKVKTFFDKIEIFNTLLL